MNVKVPLIVLLLLAAAVGYLLGTEKGRGQRDTVIAKVRRRGSDHDVTDVVAPSPGAGEGAAETPAATD
jgi:hypothetical protein